MCGNSAVTLCRGALSGCSLPAYGAYRGNAKCHALKHDVGAAEKICGEMTDFLDGELSEEKKRRFNMLYSQEISKSLATFYKRKMSRLSAEIN